MSAPRKLPGSLETNRLLERWLRINRDGTVSVFTGKVEIGQGILTAVAQAAADELDVALERVRIEPADTVHSPDEGITSGSRSIQESVTALRYAAAEARAILLERAAQKLGVSLEQVTLSDGVISARNGGSVSYWELADEHLLKREASAQAALKPAAERSYIGAALPRRDIPAKITGMPAYVQDMDLPGMLYGRIVRPPEPAGTTDSFRGMDRTTGKMEPEALADLRDTRGKYLDGLRDWAHRGAESPWSLSPEVVRSRLRGVSPDEARARAHFQLGEYLWQQRQPERARAQFDEAIRLHPESWAYRRQAWDLEQLGKSGGPEFWGAVEALGETRYYAKIEAPE